VKSKIKPAVVIEVLLHVLFWSLLVFVMGNTFNFSYRITEMENGIPVERLKIISILPLVLMRLPMQLIFFYGNIYFLLRIIYKKSGWQYGISVIIAFLACLYVELWIRVLFSSLYGLDIQFYDRVVLGLTFFYYCLFFGISFSYFLLKEWKNSERRIIEIQNQHLSTELNFLRSQVSPHFLFNTLNSLFAIAQENKNEDIAEGISKISNLLRYMLYDSNVTKIALSREVNYLKSYIELAQLRYHKEEAKVELTVTGPIDDTEIAPMLLIPFVENAFKHGVRIEKESQLKFQLIVRDGTIEFKGENPDRSTRDKVHQLEKGIGLTNVKKRLGLLYPEKGHLAYNSENGTFKFQLRIEK
jgi:two-component system, LytTR family, sensor kinase